MIKKEIKTIKRKLKKNFYKTTVQAVLISFILMILFLGVIFMLLWSNRSNLISFLIDESKMKQPANISVPIPKIIEEEVKEEETITTTPIPEEIKKEIPTVVDAVKKAKPAVVSIVALDKNTRKKVGSGSGFFVSSDGIIVTNRHVVSSVNVDYMVEVSGVSYSALILDKDPVYDVALIKIQGIGFTYLNLADSDLLEVGETVIAIGNALGEFDNTVSVGVVSGLLRSVVAEQDNNGEKEYLDKVIQTDAAINKGNSGGPLLNIKGEVVGINVAIIKNSSNIGFALPTNSVKDTIDSVKKTGKIVRPYVGIRYVLINSSIQEKDKLPFDYGILIRKGPNDEPAVIVDSPAQKAGLKEGDIILEIDGQKINSDTNFSKIIRDKKIGDIIIMKFYREGNTKILSVILEKIPINF